MFLDHTGPSRRAFCPYICRVAVLSSHSRERGLTYSFLLWHLPIMFCTLDPICLLHKICIQTPQLCINPISKIMIFFPRQCTCHCQTCSPGVKNATSTRWKNGAFANWPNWPNSSVKEMQNLDSQAAHSSQVSFDEESGADYILSSFFLIVSSLLVNIVMIWNFI